RGDLLQPPGRLLQPHAAPLRVSGGYVSPDEVAAARSCHDAAGQRDDIAQLWLVCHDSSLSRTCTGSTHRSQDVDDFLFRVAQKLFKTLLLAADDRALDAPVRHIREMRTRTVDP